ncbi:AAA-ATPase Vps4-associated 1 family protein [Aspergillus clavatus NRRL 1]|uniref:DUF1742-domain-containing protein n=1 Tax=Aspergillus clavatus (strain ATCC 1007 / CBS 513.65 / DSM 816 / NCTC 3887 / NRRL 1 / QM 1276 / 107) TaxID=344612 RepID=A1CH17_ASPCL|nr:uncharacterized protein ACLA_046380 [Aspergillus clavatus NRRL 1]EAW10172.1 conserved hypothetical protein [Aspergillus clavatus NRRL 1]
MSLQNVWHLRRVAETAARACIICYKPSSSVLITPDNKDFFYVCPVHLQDRHFCSPIVDAEEAEAKKKQEALAREIENVKKEYEEKQRRKKEKEKEKGKGKGKEDKTDEKDQDKESKKSGQDGDNEAKSMETERDEKIESIKKAASPSATDDSPRIFTLHKNFYQMRIDRLRGLEMAKRNRQRLQDPSLFPAVPSGDL